MEIFGLWSIFSIAIPQTVLKGKNKSVTIQQCDYTMRLCNNAMQLNNHTIHCKSNTFDEG